MSWKKHDYDVIPGTYVFDGQTAHSAYALNKLLYSFNHEENRRAFQQDEEAYAGRFELSDEQRHALMSGDFLGLLRLGANMYFLAKLAIPRGVSVQDTGAAFQGVSTEEFKAKLVQQSKGFQEKLDRLGGYWNG